MAGRYEKGMSVNQKRNVRRGLSDRLHLAVRDAQGASGSGGRALGHEDEPAARRARPSRAPYLSSGGVKIEAKIEELEDSAEEAEERDGVAEKVEPLDVDHESSEPEPTGGGASSWMESGLRSKTRLGATDRGGRTQLVSAEEARRAKRGTSSGSVDPPPWRVASPGCGPLAGGRGVVPRWKVEETLETGPEEERAGPDKQLVSKVATQLLRWGRSDVACTGGRVRSVHLPGWAPDEWVSLPHLAEAMGVRPDELEGALQSVGRHGPRILFEEQAGPEGPRVKARWTRSSKSGGK